MMATSILILLTLVCALAWIARRIRLPAPLLYLPGGMLYGTAASVWSGLPNLPFDSSVVFAVFFPALLYAAAFRMPWNDFRVNAVRSVVNGLALVVLTTLVIGLFAHHVLGLGWLLAFLFGVCLADPDFGYFMSRANETNTSRPLRRSVTSEGLVEGTAMLVLYVALSNAVASGSFAWGDLVFGLTIGPVIGALVGLAIALCLVPVFRRIDDPVLSVAASLLIPFIAYLPAQALGGVRLAAVVAAGLVSGERIDPVMTAKARQTGRAAWDVLVFVVNGAIYVPAGAVLVAILLRAQFDWGTVWLAAVSVPALLLIVRLAYGFGFLGIGALIGRSPGPWADMMIGTLGATRGVFAVASALALPELWGDGTLIEGRDTLVAAALAVAVVSLVIGIPLIEALLRVLPLRPDRREERERAAAWSALSKAGLAVLDRRGDEAPHAAQSLRTDLGGALDRTDEARTAPAADIPLRLAVLDAQRTALRELRDTGRISGETFQLVEGQIDHHDAYLRESADLLGKG